jgi:predicted ATPase/class 3 adenylate cyclase
MTAKRSSFAAPETYTPKHLAAKILTSKAALEGERKQVTVLFADTKGSTELLADRDPEEARKLLEPVLKLMMEAVHHYEGTVNQAAGDGIMALFGAPVAHEDHAVRACYAALRMQEQVKRHAEGVLHTFGVNLQIRVGLNSGEVVVGAIGSDLRMDYTAVGRTTHLAGRMEQLAIPGSILLTPATLDLVQGLITVKSLGPVPVKGLADPLEVYELTGAGPARTRFQAVARRGLTQFVGRDAELEQLRGMQALARAGHGQVVSIVAEPGVGKSRLVHEFCHSHVSDGWLVLDCAAVSYGKAMSYLPLTTLLRTYFGITDQDGPRQIGDKISNRLLALNLVQSNIVVQDRDSPQPISNKDASKRLVLDQALQPLLPALMAVLDVPVDDAPWQSLDPTERRRRMLDAVRRLLLREALEQPLLLIFEDLHWIDGETQALIDGLIESLTPARILLLATCRPEYRHGWASKTYYSKVPLNVLSAEGVGRLLDALLGDDPTLGPVKQLLAKGGNPFVLEESVRTLVETKALEGRPGSYRLTRPVEAIQIPATVQAMLAARIDRLSPEDKQLLQIAAVIGRRVRFSLLRAVADLPDDALRRGLDRLQAAEFVYETGLLPLADLLRSFLPDLNLHKSYVPDLEYSFKHALTQEVAYNSMLQERRRELHARAVEAIETLHHNRLDEQVELLAHHALRGDLREKAVGYLRQAGVRASARSPRQESLAWFEQALSVLDSLPEDRSTLEQGFDIRLEARRTQSQLGDFAGALRRLREAERFADKLNDDSRKAQACVLQARTHLIVGEMDEALALGNRALAMAARLDDLQLQIMTRTYLEEVHDYRGDHERVVELATANLAALPADATYDHFSSVMPVSIFDRCALVRSLAELGRFPAATKYADEAISLAGPTQQLFADAYVHQNAAILYLLQGDLPKTLSMSEHAAAIFRRGNLGPTLTVLCAAISAIAQAQLGRQVEALDLLRENHELMAHIEVRDAGVYLVMGHAHLLLGQVDEAQRLADLVVESCSSRLGHVAHACRLLGDVATHRDELDATASETHYHKALALAEARGMRPVIAHCHFGLSKLYQRTGKWKEAREHRTISITMYREMGMQFYLEQAEAAK